MSWSYSGDPTTDLDKVRFLVGDVIQSEPVLSDEEIESLIATWATEYSIYYAAAMAAEAIAARYGREATYSADGVSVSLGDIAAKMSVLAEKLRAQHAGLLVGGIPDVGGIDPYEQPDPTIRNFIFGTGMHDDIDAGRQDYGSRDFPTFYPEREPGV